MQLGPLLDGIVIMQSFVPAPTFNFPGVADVLKRYRDKAAGQKIDPFGYGFVPFGYAAGQVLAQAVEGTKSLDHAKLADYIHGHTFHTVVGDIAYSKDGKWAQPRTLVHPIPERRRRQSRSVRQRQRRNRFCGRRNTRPAP